MKGRHAWRKGWSDRGQTGWGGSEAGLVPFLFEMHEDAVAQAIGVPVAFVEEGIVGLVEAVAGVCGVDETEGFPPHGESIVVCVPLDGVGQPGSRWPIMVRTDDRGLRWGNGR
mmetsp:Transcript_10948/g.31769  ORF Transcript_10948/g.31769 Transcript_10948/m.31769 type:complete len:113 (-) Transcript_10948:2672-3010(-)